MLYTDNGEKYYLNRVKNTTVWEVPEDEKELIIEDQGPMRPYDNLLFMPLKEFAEQPESFELLHNGQTLQVCFPIAQEHRARQQRRHVEVLNIAQLLQVLGLTNYSADPDATVLRNCIINNKETAKVALLYAIERLQTFAYVGTFETMRESLASWASMRGLNMSTLSWSSNKQHAFSYDDGDEQEHDEV